MTSIEINYKISDAWCVNHFFTGNYFLLGEGWSEIFLFHTMWYNRVDTGYRMFPEFQMSTHRQSFIYLFVCLLIYFSGKHLNVKGRLLKEQKLKESLNSTFRK